MQLQPPRHPFALPCWAQRAALTLTVIWRGEEEVSENILTGCCGGICKQQFTQPWGKQACVVAGGVLREQTIKMGYGALLPPSPKLRKSEGVANTTMESLYKCLSTARFLRNGWLSLGLAAWANRVDVMGKFGSTLALRLLPRLCLRTRLQTYKQILCYFSTHTADSLGHLLGTVSFFFFF